MTKFGRLDVKAVLDDGTKVLIEMQVAMYDHLIKRFLYYWAKTYTEDLKRGEKYGDLKKTISIIILSKNLPQLKGIDKCHTKWKLREENNKEANLIDDIEIHIIELDKLNDESIDEEEFNWINFIKEGEIDMRKTVDEEIKEAEEELRRITADPEMRELYYQREKDLRDYISALDYERRTSLKEGHERGLAEGRTEGIKQGIKQGIEQGKKDSKRQIVINLRKKEIQIEDICDIVELSRSEVEKILNDNK